MRLLFLTKVSPFDELTGPVAAGAELSIRRIAEGFAKRGHEVHYVAFPETCFGSHKVNGINVHFFPYKADRFFEKNSLRSVLWSNRFVFSHFKILPEWLKRFERRLLGRLIGIREWEYLHVVESLCRSKDIQLIHSFTSLPDSLAASIVSSRLNIPLVLRMGGRFWYLKYCKLRDEHTKERYLTLVNYIFGLSSCMAYNSKFIKNESHRLYGELGMNHPEYEAVLDIGVEPVKDGTSSVLSMHVDKEAGEIVICCVGKFKKHSKRQDILIHAFSKLASEENCNIKLIFAGDGPEQESMELLADDLGVREQVIFLGSITQADVYRLLEYSDIFVHPTEFEGASKALAEAMCMGKPIVASDIPANAELVEHNVTGLLATNTIDSFACELKTMVYSEKERIRMGSSAVLFADSNLRPEVNVLRYESLFEDLTTSR